MTKKLIVAIIAVFVLLIISGIYIFILDVKEPEQPGPVNSLVETCSEWCDTKAINDWCDFELSASETLKGTCLGFSKSQIYKEFGVNSCPAIDCNNRPEVDQACISGLGGIWETPKSEGKCEQLGDTTRFVLTPTDSSPVQGQICCTPIEYFE